MKNLGKISILLILLFCSVLIFSGAINASESDGDMVLGNVSMTIPSNFLNGQLSNYSDAAIYEKIVNGDIFRVTVHNDSKYFMNMAGYDMNQAENTSQMSINGHPCLVCECGNNYMGNYTVIIFESNGSLVRVYIPNSTGLTSDGESLVSSTPPSLYSGSTFYNYLNATHKAYLNQREQENMIADSYDEGYDEGYGEGYDTSSDKWYQNIPVIGQFII